MSKSTKIYKEGSDWAFYLFIVVLFVLFLGDPDLHDKIIERVNCENTNIQE